MNSLSRYLRNVARPAAARRRLRPTRTWRPTVGVGALRFEERTLLSISLVSATPTGAASDADSVFSDPGMGSTPGQPSPTLSADGTLMVFQSDATDLVSGASDTNQATDVFVRNLQTGQTSLVSVAPDGSVGNGRSFDPVISPNGRYVAFLSTATNLSSTTASPAAATAGASTGLLYVRDLQTGTTTLLDATPGGQASDGLASPGFVFSPDSTELAFSDTSADLAGAPPTATSGGTTPVANLYVTDLAADTTTLASATPSGQLANGSASQPVFSPDGTQLAFLSTATNLVAAGASSTTTSTANSNENLFVRDLAAGTTAAASTTPAGALSSGDVTQMVFSPDSQSLAFISTGSDLTTTSADTPLALVQATGQPHLPVWLSSNVYVHNLASGTTTAVSTTPGGELSDGFAGSLSYTPDGQSLVYLSSADDLTANPNPLTSDTAPARTGVAPLPDAPWTTPVNLFVTNLATQATGLVSVTPSGTLSSGTVVSYAVSPDGTQVAFDALATDLTNNPPFLSSGPATAQATSTAMDNVFVRDLSAGTTSLISAATDGTLSSDPSFSGSAPVVFSPDGQTLYFVTGSTLLAGDTNGASDIYSATAPFTTPGAIQFTTWEYSANEADGQVAITVVRNAPVSSPATVDYQVQSGTATAGSDFQATSGTLSFAAGATSATFSIPLNTADSFSGTRTATLMLSNPSGAPLGFPTATLNLTGVLPIVPVSLTTPTPTPKHPHAHKPKAPATPTPTPTTASTTSTSSSTTATASPSSTSTVVTVYTATPTPTPTPTATNPGTPSPAGSTTGTNTPTSTGSTSNTVAATSTNSATNTNTNSATSTPAASTSTPGPVVSRVAYRTTRHKITGIIIGFSAPLAGAAAGNTANYGVNLESLGRRTKHGVRATSVGRAVGIANATYDAATQSVTLTLAKALPTTQMFQLSVNGGAGGITDSSGNPLNSPAQGMAGSNFVYSIK